MYVFVCVCMKTCCLILVEVASNEKIDRAIQCSNANIVYRTEVYRISIYICLDDSSQNVLSSYIDNIRALVNDARTISKSFIVICCSKSSYDVVSIDSSSTTTNIVYVIMMTSKFYVTVNIIIVAYDLERKKKCSHENYDQDLWKILGVEKKTSKENG